MADPLPPGARPISVPSPVPRGYSLPPGAVPAEPTNRMQSGTTLERGTLALGGGFNEAVADLIGLPIDAATGLINFLGSGAGNMVPGETERLWPRIENTPGGSQSIREVLKQTGSIGMEPQTGTEKTLRRIGYEGGASLAALTGIGTAARAGAAGNAVTRPFIEAFRQAPGAVAATEAVSAVGAGAAGSLAAEAVPPESPWYGTAQIAAEIVGGGVPDFLARGAVGVYRRGHQAFEPFTERGMRQAVGRELVQEATDPRAAIEDLETARSLETVGQASNDPGLISAERAFSARTEGAFQARQTAQNEALREWFDALKPDTGPGATQEFFNNRISAIDRTLDFHIASAGQYADEVISAQGLDMNSPEANRIVRDALTDALKFERGREKRIWNNIDSSGKLTVDPENLRTRVETWAGTTLKAEAGDVPDDVLALVNRLGVDAQDEAVMEPIEEILGLRSVVGGKIREAEAASNFNRARLLRGIRDEVDSYLNDLAFTDEGMGARYQEARDFSKQLNDKFTRGEVGRVLGTTRQGGAIVPEERTIERLFQSGEQGRVNTRQGLEALGSRTEGIHAIEQWALSNFVDSATNPLTRKIDARALARWRERFGPAVSNFPQLDEATSSVFKAQRYIDSMDALAGRTKARLERTRAASFVGYDPQVAIGRALGGANPTDSLRALVRSANRDPSGIALQGLKRGFLDMIPIELTKLDQAGNPFLNPGAMRRFLRRRSVQMTESGLFSQADLDQVMDFTDALERANRVTLATPRAGADTAQKTLTLNQMLSRLYGLERGVVGPRFVTSEVGARIINRFVSNLRQEQLTALLADAYLDPALARTLMLEVTQQNAPRTVQRLRLHLINNGYADAEEIEELNGD